MRCTISPTARMPSGPGRDRKGPCASPIPASPESVVSFTTTSLTCAIVEFDTRTGWARGAARKYVSSAVIFMPDTNLPMTFVLPSLRSRSHPCYARGASMMIAIPEMATSAPMISQGVGRTPSISQSHSTAVVT